MALSSRIRERGVVSTKLCGSVWEDVEVRRNFTEKRILLSSIDCQKAKFRNRFSEDLRSIRKGISIRQAVHLTVRHTQEEIHTSNALAIHSLVLVPNIW